MLPIPAIDIQSGKCVRLKMGNLDSAKIYYENPLEAAEFWIEKGTKRLHIVDLDGALKGASVNFSVILEIRNSFPDIEIQLGGGIRSFETVESYVKNKIDFLILGSAAIKNKAFFKEACTNYPNQIILGLDAKKGFISTEAWTESSEIRAEDLINEYSSLPINSIIYTDISKDGMLEGPNVEETQELADFSNIPTIASGGVGNLDHLVDGIKLGNASAVLAASIFHYGKYSVKEAKEYLKKNNVPVRI